MCATTFSRSNTTYYLCSVLNHLCGMKTAFGTCKALY